jgi:CO/xanthine dehydrogenase Mo-binding subunit
VGEPPVIATAAAIANAILDATGKAFFSLPIGPHHIRGIAGNGSGD